VNAAQHQIVLREAQFRCAICWLQYDAGTYYRMADSLHPLSRLTVDHLDGRQRVKRQKVDEEWSNLWVLCGECHWQKDNASQEPQRRYVERRIHELRTREGRSARVAHLVTVVQAMEAGASFRDYGREFIASRGAEPHDYAVAKEQEYLVDDPLRRVKRKKALRDDYRASYGKKKERLRFFLRQVRRRRPTEPKIRVPEKVRAQRARPILNVSVVELLDETPSSLTTP